MTDQTRSDISPKLVIFHSKTPPDRYLKTAIDGICGECCRWRKYLLMREDPPPTFVCQECAGVQRGA
jgi:hypothetical protein